MPEIGETCVFSVDADKVILQKNQNGYVLTMQELNLSQENAAILSWLANSGTMNVSLSEQ